MGLIKIKQGSSTKTCYPFMKGALEKIAFCPVWHAKDGTSFLPYGAKAIWKPDLQNETVQWNVRQFTATTKDNSTHSLTPQGSFTHKFVSSFGYSLTNTSIDRDSGNKSIPTSATVINSLLGPAGSTAISASEPFVIYPVKNYWEYYYGIVPALESECMGKKSTGTMIFGAVMMLPSAQKDGYVSACWCEGPLGKTIKIENNAYRPGPSSWYVNAPSYQRSWYWQVTGQTNTIKPDWPSNGTDIFTGLKWLGHDNSLGGEMMFFQGTATVNSGTIIMPPHYVYVRTGVTNPTYMHIYDSWIAFKT